MGNFGYLGSNDLPTLLDYAQAVRWEAGITPLSSRSNMPGVKPLRRGKAGRQFKRLLIGKENDDIVVSLFGEPLIRYQPDGKIILTSLLGDSRYSGGRLTTRMVLNGVLAWGTPSGLSVYTGHNILWVRGLPAEDGEFVSVPFDKARGPVTLVGAGTRQLRILDAPKALVHRVDRKAMNRAKVPYRGFLDYAKGMVGLLREQNAGVQAAKYSALLKQVFGETTGTYEGYNGYKQTFTRLNAPKELMHWRWNRQMDEGVESLLSDMRSGEPERWLRAFATLAFHVNAGANYGYRSDAPASTPGVLSLVKKLLVTTDPKGILVPVEVVSSKAVGDPWRRYVG